MRTHLVGKKSVFYGKRLFDILARLREFGAGRILYRDSDLRNFPEISYIIPLKVIPKLHKRNDPLSLYPLGITGEVLCSRVFRGEKMGLYQITEKEASLPDWRLVMRSSEDEFLNSRPKRNMPIRITYDKMPLPCLLDKTCRKTLLEFNHDINRETPLYADATHAHTEESQRYLLIRDLENAGAIVQKPKSLDASNLSLEDFERLSKETTVLESNTLKQTISNEYSLPTTE